MSALILTAKNCTKDLLPGEVSLFPTESISSVTLSQEELFHLSPLYARLYRSLVSSIADRLSEHFKISLESAAILSREAIVPLTHFFMDRLLRLNRLVKAHPDSSFEIPSSGTLPFSPRIETFESLVCSSRTFNESLLELLAPIFDIPVSPSRKEEIPSRQKKNQGFLNENYSQDPWIKLKRAFHLGLSRGLSLIHPRLEGQIPVLSMGYASPYLQAAGFYGPRGFLHSMQRVTFDAPRPEEALRQKLLLPALKDRHDVIEQFLVEALAIEPVRRPRVLETFFRYVGTHYPSSLLEGLTSNLEKSIRYLRRYRAKSIICADAGNVESTFFFAAARALGLRVVGYQQGGHEGYEDDYVQAGEAEYHYFDQFISWGWRRFPDRHEFQRMEVIPLPSPWLYERSRRWKRALSNGAGKEKPLFDFLLMPNKIYPYPPAPSGGNISRIDHVQVFARLLEEFVSKATRKGFAILHKPYNHQTRNLLAETHERLSRLGGERYRSLEPQFKGIIPHLLRRCRMVIWDQPGTGFLECLTSELPTMVLWSRFYNREVPWAQELFSKLKSTGLIHTSVESLLERYLEFLAAPRNWLKNPVRQDAISLFCRQFAWAEQDWRRYWHRFVKSLANR